MVIIIIIGNIGILKMSKSSLNCRRDFGQMLIIHGAKFLFVQIPEVIMFNLCWIEKHNRRYIYLACSAYSWSAHAAYAMNINMLAYLPSLVVQITQNTLKLAIKSSLPPLVDLNSYSQGRAFLRNKIVATRVKIN